MNPFLDLATVEGHWKALEEESSVSFFNSWGWISTWLETLPKDLSIEFILVTDSNGPICCFFLGITKKVQNKFRKKRGYLNSVGEFGFDDIVIEYNSILCRKDKDLQTLLDFTIGSLKDIEEFRLPLSVNIDYSNSEDYFQRVESIPSRWTDLNKIEEGKDFLSLVSKNKRTQIKRSIKEYEKDSPIKFETAKTKEEALDLFSGLEELHQKEWIKRGQPGAFSNPYFKDFHKTLIQNRFEKGEIQLAKVSNDKEVLGYLYYFIFNNEALFYQSGFNFKESNIYRPGLVCHYLATNHFANESFQKYNFLAGDTGYKKSLATDEDTLSSIVISRKTIKSRVEQQLRRHLGKTC